jgi:hypothetical protein
MHTIRCFSKVYDNIHKHHFPHSNQVFFVCSIVCGIVGIQVDVNASKVLVNDSDFASKSA